MSETRTLLRTLNWKREVGLEQRTALSRQSTALGAARATTSSQRCADPFGNFRQRDLTAWQVEVLAMAGGRESEAGHVAAARDLGLDPLSSWRRRRRAASASCCQQKLNVH